MNDRPPLNDREEQARRSLVVLSAAMLSGGATFFEGAVEILRLKQAVGGIAERDPDFDAFVLIGSETDHLPLKAQEHLWNPNALEKLRPELESTEKWAATFAPEACRNLIARFGAKTENRPLHPTAFGVG